MSDDNIWLQGRRRETAALEAITAALEAEPGHRDGTSTAGAGDTDTRAAGPRAVRRAGVAARTARPPPAPPEKGTNQA